ncbi:MAG: integrase [Clostridia bacterium]|nr:integrase [Clostridia bacterium]
MLTEGGFKPLSKEEKDEAKRIALEAGFSFEGYQVVRREFFSHRYDPTLTIKGNSITFNNACISRLEEVVYVQVLVNPLTETLVIRPCSEGARDAIRWCIAKNDKRKSRQITCGIFTAKLYELMGWEALYRYKLQGTQITHKGEQLFVFDLTSTETFLPATKDPENPDAKPKRRPPVYPANWRDSFGIPVAQHEASTKVNLEEGYSYADELPDKTGTYGSQKAGPVSEVV